MVFKVEVRSERLHLVYCPCRLKCRVKSVQCCIHLFLDVKRARNSWIRDEKTCVRSSDPYFLTSTHLAYYCTKWVGMRVSVSKSYKPLPILPSQSCGVRRISDAAGPSNKQLSCSGNKHVYLFIKQKHSVVFVCVCETYSTYRLHSC